MTSEAGADRSGPADRTPSDDPVTDDDWGIVGIEYFDDESTQGPPSPPTALSALVDERADRGRADDSARPSRARAPRKPRPARQPAATERAASPVVPPEPPGPRPSAQRVRWRSPGRLLVGAVALVCVALAVAVFVKTRSDAAVAAREAAVYTAPSLDPASPVALGPAIAIVGDDGVTQATPGVPQEARWPGLIQSNLSGAVTSLASAGSGYTTRTGSGRTFVDQAKAVPKNAEVVLLFGGAADRGAASISVARAATAAISAADARAPDAKIIVIGPIIAAGATSAESTAVRNGLRTAAGIARVTWIDPIAAAWLPARVQSAMSATALTAADEKTVATKIEAAVERALR